MIVVKNESDGPGVRAIVIGVGRYPNAQQWNLRDLSSATVSALEFALWLKENLNYPDRPLKYLDVIISQPENWQEPEEINSKKRRLSPSWDYETTQFNNIKQAIENWRAQFEYESSRNDVAIFYFCGHGIEHEGVIALLAEDFEAREQDTEFYNTSLDLRKFHQGTARLTARNKYFFIDSCRSDPPQLEGYQINPNPVINPEVGRKHPGDAPIYFATKEGEQAWGQPNEVAQFTNAIIRALNGAAGDRGRYDSETRWVVKGSELLKGIRAILNSALSSGNNTNQKADIENFPEETIIHVPRDNAQIPVKVTWTANWTSVFFENLKTQERVVISDGTNPLIISALDIPNPTGIVKPCGIRNCGTIESFDSDIQPLQPPMLKYDFQ
ncbi:MAG: caspase family protein [Prochloraceae cyanobacterium]|nr:caspase family protein [Prochloraceae cyanobacterium]